MLYVAQAQRGREIIILFHGQNGDFCRFHVIFALQGNSSVTDKHHFDKFISPKYIGQGRE